MKFVLQMAELNISHKKDWAKTLYTVERLTQKEIAKKVGVSEKTMSQWVNKYHWEELRVSLIITKEAQLKRLYAQINEVNTAIEDKPEGKRYANSAEADILIKLTAAADKLETETGIKDIIEVFKGFTNWLKVIDLAKAQDIIKLQDEYIKTKIK